MDALCRRFRLGFVHAFIDAYRIGGNRLFYSLLLCCRSFGAVRRFVADARNRFFDSRLDSPRAWRRHVSNHAGFCAGRSGYGCAHRLYDPQRRRRYRFGNRDLFIVRPYRLRPHKKRKNPKGKAGKQCKDGRINIIFVFLPIKYVCLSKISININMYTRWRLRFYENNQNK